MEQRTDFLHFDVTQKILGAIYRVYGRLGSGFSDKLYQNALAHELSKNHVRVIQMCPLTMKYDGEPIGEYCVDMLVEGKVIVAVKADKSLSEFYENQLISCLKSSDIEVGILVNFGYTLEFRRKIYSNSRKNYQRSSA